MVDIDGSGMRFSLDTREGVVFACEWTADQNFSCADAVVDETDHSQNSIPIEALIRVTATLEGSFNSEVEMTGLRIIEMVCEGVDCPTLAETGMDLPCEMTEGFNAALIEE